MKCIPFALPLFLLGLSPAWGEHQQPPLAESVKAARVRSLDAGQIIVVRTIAKALLDAKTRQAGDDQRAVLGAELENLRNQLSAHQLAHRQEPAKRLDASDEGHASAAHANPMSAILVGALTGLRDKRTGLEAVANRHPELADALNKAKELETEFGEIAGLPAEEQAARLNDLSMRLTPRRASEFAGAGRLQPTLTIGRQAQRNE